MLKFADGRITILTTGYVLRIYLHLEVHSVVVVHWNDLNVGNGSIYIILTID